MYYKTEDIKKLEDFHKYARFICDHFDIQIELDSTKAQTDGRTIKLPNVVGLNENETDMMYTILLHEAGHIKFSCFTEEAFLKIKSQSHAFLANAIEDARIENLLMKEFGGAKEMFERFYTEHAVNRKLMKRVFNFSGKRPDVFNCLGLYVHAYLLDCKTAAFSRIATRGAYISVKSFIKKHNIDNILDNAPLKNWDDVVSLTDTIYSLFVKDFKDSSPKCDFAKDLALKREVEEQLKKIQQEIEQAQEQADVLKEQVKEKQKQYNEWYSEVGDDVKDLEKSIAEHTQEYKKFADAYSKRNSVNSAERSMNNAENKHQTMRDKLAKAREALHDLQDKINSGLNASGKPFTEKQKEANAKSLESKRSNAINYNNKAHEADKKLEQARKDYESAKKDENPAFDNMTTEELHDTYSELSEKLAEQSHAYNEMTAEGQAIAGQIASLEQGIDNIFTQVQERLLNKMYELDKKGMGQEIPMNILPEFEETPGWAEADAAQQQFDARASNERKEIIRNGGRMAGLLGSNLRDLSVYIDKKLETVKEINLLDIFEKKSGVSRFPELNVGDEGMNTNNSADKSIRSAFGSLQKHTVLTTQFDIVKNENVAKDAKLSKQLMMQNVDFFRVLKRTFMNRFKFTKKDYYRGGKEEGQLDNRNLWKLPTRQGDDYFEVNNPKFVNKMAATILIDVSGSQDKDETNYGEKLQVLALALSEALKGVHVNHEVLGFHAPVSEEMRAAGAAQHYNRRSNKLETLVYKTFNQRDNSAITNMEVQSSDNSDGESVRVALQRLKRERAKSKVMFIITDGKPFLSDGDVTILDEDLKTALREAVNNKVQVFALGFSPNGQDFYGDRFCYIQNYNDVIKFVEKIAL